jgi:hypothetical protein
LCRRHGRRDESRREGGANERASFFSEFVSSDSGTYDALVELVHEYHVGGMLVFGTRQAQPDVLLNRACARNTRDQSLNAASFNKNAFNLSPPYRC